MKKSAGIISLLTAVILMLSLCACGAKGYSETVTLNDGNEWTSVETEILSSDEGADGLVITLEGPQSVSITCDDKNYSALVTFTDADGYSEDYRFIYHSSESGQEGVEFFNINDDIEETEGATEEYTGFASPAPVAEKDGPVGVYAMASTHADVLDKDGNVTKSTDTPADETEGTYIYFDGTGDKYLITYDGTESYVFADEANTGKSDYTSGGVMPQYSEKDLEFDKGSGYWDTGMQRFSYWLYDKETDTVTVVSMTQHTDTNGIPYVANKERVTYTLTDYKNIDGLLKSLSE